MDANILYTDVSNLDLSLKNKLPNFRQKIFDELKFEKDKRLSIGVWLLYMQVFGDTPVSYTKNNKPYIEGSQVQFNFSHSGKYAIVAYAEAEIGCDMEKIRPFDEKLAKRCMQDSELAVINGNADEFCRFWTLKESYLKATSQGLSVDPKSFSIFDIKDYTFAEFDIDKKYKSSLCLKGENLNITIETEAIAI